MVEIKTARSIRRQRRSKRVSSFTSRSVLDLPDEVEHGAGLRRVEARPTRRTAGISRRAPRRSWGSPGCPCRSRRGPRAPRPSASSISMIVVILSKPAASASGCTPNSTLRDHGLHVGAVHDRVGELLEARLALEQQDGHAELHAELRLQLVRGPVVDERVGHVVVGADRHALHVLRPDVVREDQLHHHRHARMRERARGMRLDRDTRGGERPRLAQLVRDRSRRCSRRPPRGRTRGRPRARWARR